ncbi:polyamine aminopropyltransferase [Kiloniella laminariae]|uniref:Polyamine aminopropyltransferase n=1 Tax=Kiloniella laminariae TaxID=454162 RepID=A0ABT4LDL0_9PROT|nr:polyamine aminopropyltransferase [Kiloniella laminariae]MCZ4279191.1 polyamine aminopropyltransferase [Kiloniella laminariae]
MLWFEENIHPEIRQVIRMDHRVYEGNTDFQSVQIFDNDLLGRVMVIDGAVQLTEFDEHIYSESLTHVAVMSHPTATRVLIIGGGDGTILREVVKHKDLESVTMVDLDGALVALCQEHFSSIQQGAYDDPRVNLIIGDGARFLLETDQLFDVIIIDSTDPDENSEGLFTDDFYASCKDRLAPGGILVAQAGCPAFQDSVVVHMRERMQAKFRFGGFYYAAVPTYIGGLHAFSWASDEHDLSQLAETGALEKRTKPVTRYYSARSHKAAFYLEP